MLSSNNNYFSLSNKLNLRLYKPSSVDLFIISLITLIGTLNATSFVPGKQVYIDDASIYLSWVRDFPNILNNYINPYHIKKTFPSSFVNIIMRGLKIYPTDQNIILVFKYYNLFLLIASAFFWTQIASFFNINNRGKIVGSIFIFINLFILQVWNIVPVNIDQTAFFLHLLLLYGYFINANTIIIIIALISGFTWPSLPISCFIFLIFPFQLPNENETGTERVKSIFDKLNFEKTLPYIVSIVAVIFTTIQYYGGYYISWCYPAKFSDYTPFLHPFEPISILLIGISLFFSFKYLIKNTLAIQIIYSLLNKATWKKLTFVILLVIISKAIVYLFAADIPPVVSFERIISSTFVLSLIFPFAFLISHVQYFGPVIILIIYFYKDIINLIYKKGSIGLILVLSIGLIFGINPESRYSFNSVQILTVFLVILLQKKIIFKNILLFTLLQFAYSLIWVYPKDSVLKYYYRGGPWTTHIEYVVYGISIIITCIILYPTLRKLKWTK